MYYTYILLSEKDGKFYTGYTKNLELRFEQHNKGLVPSTCERRPLILICYEACLNQQDAIRREKYLKTYHENVYKKKTQILFNRVKIRGGESCQPEADLSLAEKLVILPPQSSPEGRGGN